MLLSLRKFQLQNEGKEKAETKKNSNLRQKGHVMKLNWIETKAKEETERHVRDRIMYFPLSTL